MVNEQLLSFIRQSRQTGTSDEQIRQSLLSSGWQTQDIQEAFSSLDSRLPESTSDLPTFSNKYLKLIIPFAVITILVGGYFVSAKFLFNIWPFTKEIEAPAESTQSNLDSGGGEIKQQDQIPEKAGVGGGFNQLSTKLTTIPNNYSVDRFVLSQNGKRWGYTVKMPSTAFNIIDGNEDRRYPKVSNPVFSPDSQRVAYWAENENGEEFMVIDGQGGEKYEDVNGFYFSPDSKHFAYVADKNGVEMVIVDGKPSKTYDNIRELAWSSNNKLAFVANEKGNGSIQEFIVMDGKDGEKFDELKGGYAVRYLTFSPNGTRFAFVRANKTEAWIVVDGQSAKKYRVVGRPLFSPDSKKIVYNAKVTLDGQDLIVVDDKEYKPNIKLHNEYYDVAPLRPFIFSLDSQKLAYIARRDSEEEQSDGSTIFSTYYFVTPTNSYPEKGYDFISAPVWNLGSDKLAYLAGKYNPSKEGLDYFSVVNLLIPRSSAARLPFF